jgi:hypothetical protein
MRFGKSPGLPLALLPAAVLSLGLGWASSARADGFFPPYTIPRVVDAYDYTTGRTYMAPPVPYGHYAKDYVADLDKHLGCVSCRLHSLAGLGGPGHGLFHHGQGDGNCADGNCGNGCGAGHGLFHHGKGGANCGGTGSACGVPGCGGGMTCGLLGHGKGGAGYACTTAGPSAQSVAAPSAQAMCGQAGCNVKSKHSHFGHGGGAGGAVCGDPGCGSGHGHGFGHGKGQGTGCGFCGGTGCSKCLGGLGSHLHSKLASFAATALHLGPRTSYFLGAGGPVPLTPGYVPYIVATRSPRDYFAFPPMNPNDP